LRDLLISAIQRISKEGICRDIRSCRKGTWNSI